MKEEFTGEIYAKVAFPIFRRIFRASPLVIYYHIASNINGPHVKNLYTFRNLSEFARDIDVLLKFFHPVSLQDFLLAFNGERVLPRNSFMLTFDDGLKECYESCCTNSKTLLYFGYILRM